MPENTAWLALAGALLGGSGLKVIEYWLNRPKTKEDIASEFRNELREDVKSLRERVTALEKQVDYWREKYYALWEDQLAEHKPKKGHMDAIKSMDRPPK